MKRFKLKSGHIIKVDDTDAWLLRSHVFIGFLYYDGTDRVTITKLGKMHSSDEHLSHIITGCKSEEFVLHRNSDQLDFRRTNLEVLPRQAALEKLAKMARATKRLNALVAKM